MAAAHRGAEAVAVFATALALAACGADVPDDPSVSVGPSLPTESDGEESEKSVDESDPTVTPPAATGTATQAPPPRTPPAEVTSSQGEVASTSVAPTATTGTLPAFTAASEVATQDPGGGAQLVIDDVRVGLQDGYDRVVLDLSGAGEVGWRARYVTDAVLDGSGAPVDLAGESLLQVDLLGMAYPEPGDTAYEDGVLLVDGGELTAVTEILRTAPFEGQVPVFVGTSSQVPFRVFQLDDPERLVIDLRHG